MLNKITLSIIISFFIIFHNFSSLNAEINIFKNIEVKSDFPNGINFIVETENNINIKSIFGIYTYVPILVKNIYHLELLLIIILRLQIYQIKYIELNKKFLYIQMLGLNGKISQII